MDLGDILRVIGKRWYIMLPVVLVTVAMTATAYLQIPMKYQSTSQISLLSPQQQASGAFKGQSNPFLIFDTSLTSTADLLARNLGSHDSAEELAAKGVTEEYAAKLADFAQGPFISLTVTGTDKAHVLASTITLTAFARDRLREIQQKNGVPADNMIQTTVVIPPQPPAPMLKGKLQIVLAVLAGGLVLAFMATFITEGLARSRRRNRRAATVAAARRVLAPDPPPQMAAAAETRSSEDTAVIVVPAELRSAGRTTQLPVGAANGASGKTVDAPAVPPVTMTKADAGGESTSVLVTTQHHEDHQGERRGDHREEHHEQSPSVPIPRGIPADDYFDARDADHDRSDSRWLTDSPTEAIRTGRRTQPSTNGNGKPAQSSALYRSAYAARDGADADAGD